MNIKSNMHVKEHGSVKNACGLVIKIAIQYNQMQWVETFFSHFHVVFNNGRFFSFPIFITEVDFCMWFM
jgi:hypothetical protein